MSTNPAYPDYTSDGKFRVIGTRPIRHDGEDKVTGRAVYGADVRPADVLYGKMLRSPHAHARIRGDRHVEGGGSWTASAP